jgi:ribosome-associated protein
VTTQNNGVRVSQRMGTVGEPGRGAHRGSPGPPGRPLQVAGSHRRSKEHHLRPSLDHALAAAAAASSKQAQDICVLDVSEPLVISDYFVICSGGSDRHVRAIVEEVERVCRGRGVRPTHREGAQAARWILLDFTDFVVHVFLEEEREFYNLERLWQDVPVVARSDDLGSLVTA